MEADERPGKIRRLTSPKEVSKTIDDAEIAITEGSHVEPPTLSNPDSSDAVALDAANPSAEAPTAGEAPLTKSALKRLRKKQAWEAARPARIEARKARVAARKAAARAARDAAKLSDAPAPSSPDGVILRARGNAHRRMHPPLPVALVLDCGFDALMTEKEVMSLASQVTRCYSETARAGSARPQLVVAGVDGRLRARFDGTLNGDYRHWRGVEMLFDDLPTVLARLSFAPASWAAAREAELWTAAEIAAAEGSPAPAGAMAASSTTANGLGEGSPDGETKKSVDVGDAADATDATDAVAPPVPCRRVVYLTADADETLERLEPGTAYIIGALVDRNRHKGVCRRRADELGLRSAKLPLADHLAMSSRQVLTTNHVVEIMLYWLAGIGWPAALERVVPKRKGAVMKNSVMVDGGIDAEIENANEDDADEIRRVDNKEVGEEGPGSDGDDAGTQDASKT